MRHFLLRSHHFSNPDTKGIISFHITFNLISAILGRPIRVLPGRKRSARSRIPKNPPPPGTSANSVYVVVKAEPELFSFLPDFVTNNEQLHVPISEG